MLKRVAWLGFSATMMIAANPPGAAKALWNGCYDRPCHYTCYRSYCYPRYYGSYRWHEETPRYRSEGPHIHYHYTEHPHYHYYDYPRGGEYSRGGGYARYGHGYDPYDGSYYRYYSDYRYDDRYYYDW